MFYLEASLDPNPGLTFQPESRCLNLRAIDRLRCGDTEGALDDFQRSLDLDPGYAEAWNNRGLVRQTLGRHAEAVADFDRALAARPYYAEALTNRGRGRQALGDLDGARADFDRALACASGRFIASVLHNRGALRQLQGDLAGALADYDRALAADPAHAATYVHRGLARKQLGDLPGARADFDLALQRLRPERSAAAWHARGGVRALQNDFAGAIADYDRAIGLEPENACFYLSRGNARYHRRDRRCLADYRMASRLDPDAAAREVARFVREDACRDAQAVLDNCAKHLRLSDRDVLAYGRRGLTLVLLRRDAEAESDFAHFRALAPELAALLGRCLEILQPARGASPAP